MSLWDDILAAGPRPRTLPSSYIAAKGLDTTRPFCHLSVP